MSGRFDYVQFDSETQKRQLDLRGLCEELEDRIEELGPSRTASLAMTKLEECYMWAGKALRDRHEKWADRHEPTEA